MAASKSTRRPTSSTAPSPEKHPVSNGRKKTAKSALQPSEDQYRRLLPFVYEQLYLFNLHTLEIIEMLKMARGKPGISKEMSAYYQSLVQEVRSLASQDILESLDEVEIQHAMLSSRQRKEHEKRLYNLK